MPSSARGGERTGDCRVEIVHVDLDQPIGTDSTPSSGSRLVVFWSGQAPVGSAYTSPGQVSCLREIASSSVAPEALLAAREPTRRGGSLTISVVICSRDRPDDLERCLASLRSQTRKPDQVLVVDNASSDERTMLVARRAGVDCIREERPGLDIARNTGVLAAAGEIIAYADDDVVLHTRWVERMLAAFDSETVWAVTGLVLPGELETGAQQVFERHWGFGRGFVPKDFGPLFYETYRHRGCPAWKIGAGASMAFRRTVFDVVGLFDERLDAGAAGCSGDSELWYRILHHGGTCRYDPRAVAFHYHRRSFDALARQIRAYMRGHTAALLVQYERTRDLGNLRRLLLQLPAEYGRTMVKRLVHRRAPLDHLLVQKILGSMEGVTYYLRAAQPSSTSRHR